MTLQKRNDLSWFSLRKIQGGSTTDPNQLGGYTYAGNNPIAHADPSGLTVSLSPSLRAVQKMGWKRRSAF
jgi:hypothetical protein